MIRGTTAKFKFKIPYPYESLSGVKVVIWQEENKVVCIKDSNKDEDVARFNGSGGNEVYVYLTPNETLYFSENYKAKAQLQGYFGGSENDDSFASQEQLVPVHPIYKGSDFSDFDIIVPSADYVIINGGEI